MNAPTGSGALPLQEYRRDIPPGWSPGDSSYSLRSYMEKLRIWYRIYNGDDESVGPLVAGRLYGQASRIAMNLRVPRPHGGYDSGDAALVRLAVDEVTDPHTGAVIQQHIPSGVQTLMNQLRATFGQQDQDLATPPANVWRHLAKFDPQFDIGEDNISNYGLLCLKPIYGLNDAPLAWQLVLHEYVLSEGATASKMDESFFMWRQDGVPDSIYGVLTCHVDDLAIAGEAKWLDGLYERMVKKFKKVTRQTMPFEHCGAEYSETNQGLCISQKAFTERLQPTVVPNRPDEDKLKPEEVTMFRSQLGALLWLTSTRLDLIAEVSFLQSKVTTAQIKDLKQTNNVIQKAKDYKELGIHYRRFETKNQRLVCIHDASSASKGRNYMLKKVCLWRSRMTTSLITSRRRRLTRTR